MKKATHLLTTEGILASFSISKKITEKEINAFAKKAMTKGKSDDEIVNMVKEKIMHEIIEASQKGLLPCMVLGDAPAEIIPENTVIVLNRMVELLSKKIKGKKYSKLELCYFINYLVGSLGLTEEDFDNFHRRISDSDESEDDEDSPEE